MSQLQRTKHCNKCKEDKTVEMFHKNRSRSDGFAGWCKDCMNLACSDSISDICSCGNKKVNRSIKCMECEIKSRKREGVKYTPGKSISVNGYVYLRGYSKHPNAQKNGQLAEHVFVMVNMIGRPLLPGENVHHKNGIRHDNRPENLELWTSGQPKGQRVSDLIEFYTLFLESRGYTVVAPKNNVEVGLFDESNE